MSRKLYTTRQLQVTSEEKRESPRDVTYQMVPIAMTLRLT